MDFARSGGEANAIAIRIARAATGEIKWQYAVTTVGTIGILLRTWETTQGWRNIFYRSKPNGVPKGLGVQ